MDFLEILKYRLQFTYFRQVVGLIKPGWVVALREHQFYSAMSIIFGEQVI